MRSIAITNRGLVRRINQDIVYASDTPVGPLANFYIVADGMGGENAGDIASKQTIRLLLEHLETSNLEPINAIDAGLQDTNYRIYRLSRSHSHYHGMGSTLVAATFIQNQLLVANVGDSRLYYIDETSINQVTNDHSYVEEMCAKGLLKRDSKEYRENKNYITRAVGAEREIQPDYFMFEVRKDDIILLCSDGLTNMVSDLEIYQIIKSAKTLEEAGKNLVHAANQRGGKDNISVVLVTDLESEGVV